MEFKGFTPETVDFLWGIRMNNNREWFLEHKKDYVNHLYEPMKALGWDLFQPFLEKTGSLLKVSRIYSPFSLDSLLLLLFSLLTVDFLPALCLFSAFQEV